MKFLRWAGAILLACLLATPAAAQTLTPQCRNAAGAYLPCTPAVLVDKFGNAIDPSNPIPQTQVPLVAATSTPLTGTSTGAQMVGPFTPVLGRPITLALSATPWPGGSAQLLRSTDGGLTKLPLTPAGVTVGVYSASGADSPWLETEAGATFYLALPGAGISYRVAQ